MNKLINPRLIGMVSVRDEKIAMGREMTSAERRTEAYQSFWGPSFDISDKRWRPLLRSLARAIRRELAA